MNIFKEEKTNLIIIFLVAFILRLVFILTTDNYFHGGDIFVRMNISYNLAHYFSLYVNPDWQPVHFWLLALLYKLTGDVSFAPRLLGLITGSLLPCYCYLIGRRLYGKSAALFSSLLISTYFIFILFSGLTYSGIPNLFFIFAGFYYFIRFFEEEKRDNRKDLMRLIVLSATSFAMANGHRAESWLIAFLLGCYLLYRKRISVYTLVYGAISSSTILLFFWINYKVMGSFTHFIEFSDFEVLEASKMDTPALWYLLEFSSMAYPFLILPLGFIGCLLSLKDKKLLPYSASLLVLMGLSYYKLINMTLLPDQRYYMIFSIWFCVMAPYAFIKIKKMTIYQPYIFSVLFVLITGFQYKTYSYFKSELFPKFPLHFTKSEKKLFSFLSEKVKGSGLIYLDNGKNTMERAVSYMSGLLYEDISCSVPNRHWIKEVFHEEQVSECFKRENKPNYLVLFPMEDVFGNLHKFYNSQKGAQYFSKMNPEKVFDSGGYKVIKLNLSH
jgi:4-amino-4-deoxy-L-arabinose transferase-like glycosyltransferase